MKAKLRALTLERWRFTAKQEEEDAAAASEAASAPSKKGQKRARSVGGAPALHPLIPTKAPVAEEELAVELSRQGLLRSDATSAAAALSAASAAAASNLLKLAHAAASGRPLPPPPITLTFNRHTIDVSSGKLQMKLSRQAYAKLAHFHRVAMPSEGAAVLPPATETLIETSEAADGEHMEAKRARLHYERESRAAEAEQRQRADTGEEATNGGRTALHQRLFALLLRYKTIQVTHETAIRLVRCPCTAAAAQRASHAVPLALVSPSHHAGPRLPGGHRPSRVAAAAQEARRRRRGLRLAAQRLPARLWIRLP
jgi:hypothetical protein